MRNRRAFAVVVALASASLGVLSAATPVAAECTFVPSLPKVSMAAATAKELFVGRVVANGPTGGFAFTVRVEEVLRGNAKIGDLREFSYVQPNWPWTLARGKPFPACTYLYGAVGETLIVALGARTSGGTMHDPSGTWYQPPTTFSTVGITTKPGPSSGDPYNRQVFSLERLRELVASPPPPTDTSASPPSASIRPDRDIRPPLLTLFLVSAAVFMWLRVKRRDHRDPG